MSKEEGNSSSPEPTDIDPAKLPLDLIVGKTGIEDMFNKINELCAEVRNLKQKSKK